VGSGTLGCLDNCTWDVTGCSQCGDRIVQPGEQCDGDNLQGLTCEALGLGFGELFCDPRMCTFDTSGCVPSGCGDGMVQPGEQCDGANLQGFTCAAVGLGGGVLSCDPAECVFDTSGCML
jgi:cysteine-rich repeat protein